MNKAQVILMNSKFFHAVWPALLFILAFSLPGCPGSGVEKASSQEGSGNTVQEAGPERSQLPDSTFQGRLPESLTFISREEWGAQPPILEMQPHTIERITIHHSAVLASPDMDPVKKMQGLQNFSQSNTVLGNGKPKPAWADVPYHFVIYPNGEVAEGRGPQFVGDTNTKYDPSGHLLINVEGNFEEQQPTEEQMEALIQLVTSASRHYQVEAEFIEGHRDFAQTACPGKNLWEKLEGLRERVRDEIDRPE